MTTHSSSVLPLYEPIDVSQESELFTTKPVPSPETKPTNKRYLQPEDVYEMSIELGSQILEKGFRPDFIVALWRGGAQPGCYVQGFLASKGINSDHVPIRTSSYDNNGTQQREIRIHSIGYLTHQLESHHKVLIVDDVLDSGRTIDAFIEKMRSTLRRNFPVDLRVATLFYKPKSNKTNIVPDFYVKETSAWLVFPHELEDLTPEEIREHYPRISQHYLAPPSRPINIKPVVLGHAWI